MIKRFVGCGGGSLKVGEGDVLGGYCINKGKGEKRREVKLMGGRVVVLQGDTALRECVLVNGWYQER
jgi:hypothetical protein